MTRQCGDCQACCRILPLRELDKPANTKCEYQRFGKGCVRYARRPVPCVLWSCAWLTGEDTADLRRPDRSHYVIDIVPDFATVANEGVEPARIEVVQIWIDPAYPDAHRDPALRDYLERRAAERKIGLIRYGSNKAMALIAPSISGTGQWVEKHSDCVERQHTAAEIQAALAAQQESVA